MRTNIQILKGNFVSPFGCIADRLMVYCLHEIEQMFYKRREQLDEG